MPQLSVTGKVLEVLPLQQGTSRSGNPWKKSGVVIETIEQYPKKVCMTVFGDKVDQMLPTIGVGMVYTFHIDISSREYEGRWYTEVSTYSVVNSADTGMQQPPQQYQQFPQQPPQQTYQPQPQYGQPPFGGGFGGGNGFGNDQPF